MPQALPRGPPPGGPRGEEGHRRPRHRRHQRVGRLPQLRHPQRVDRAAPVQLDVQDVRRRAAERRPTSPTCGPRRRRASSSTSRTSSTPRAAQCPSASRRWARLSATRSRRATSSSARASSSRWRWSGSATRTKPRVVRVLVRTRTKWWNLGVTSENLQVLRHERDELAHYAKEARHGRHRVPLPVLGPRLRRARGRGPSQRLRPEAAQKFSQEQPLVLRHRHERFVPHVIEPAAGLARVLLAFLHRRLRRGPDPEMKGGGQARRAAPHPRLAPVKVAVLPAEAATLTSRPAKAMAAELRPTGTSSSTTRRHRSALPPPDEIGTPFCVTVDFETLDDNAVTIRERDSMAQERVSLDGITRWFAERLVGC